MCGESKDESAPNSYTNGATERARCAPRALARCSIYSPLCTGTPANIRHSLRKRKGLPLVGTRTVIHDYGSLHFSFFTATRQQVYLEHGTRSQRHTCHHSLFRKFNMELLAIHLPKRTFSTGLDGAPSLLEDDIATHMQLKKSLFVSRYFKQHQNVTFIANKILERHHVQAWRLPLQDFMWPHNIHQQVRQTVRLASQALLFMVGEGIFAFSISFTKHVLLEATRCRFG